MAKMRKYDALVACDVPAYGWVNDIEAETPEQAIEIATHEFDDVLLEMEWDNSHSSRIVHISDITDSNGEIVREDIDIAKTQAYLLSPDMARLHNAAPKLRETVVALLKWAEFMGGWDAPCWEMARSALELSQPRLPTQPAQEPAQSDFHNKAFC